MCKFCSFSNDLQVTYLGLSPKVGRGLGDWDVGLRNAETWGLGDVGREHARVLEDVGRDKQTSPDFCAEFARYEHIFVEYDYILCRHLNTTIQKQKFSQCLCCMH